MNCPKCQTHCKKLSQIVMEETRHTNSTGSLSLSGVELGSGGIGVGLGSGSMVSDGVVKSARAIEFAPPRKSDEFAEYAWFLSMFGLALISIMAFKGVGFFIGQTGGQGPSVSSLSQELFTAIQFLLPITICLMVVVVGYKVIVLSNKEEEIARTEYKAKYQKWEKLFYCDHDHIIYDSEGIIAPANKEGVASLINIQSNVEPIN